MAPEEMRMLGYKEDGKGAVVPVGSTAVAGHTKTAGEGGR